MTQSTLTDHLTADPCILVIPMGRTVTGRRKLLIMLRRPDKTGFTNWSRLLSHKSGGEHYIMGDFGVWPDTGLENIMESICDAAEKLTGVQGVQWDHLSVPRD